MDKKRLLELAGIDSTQTPNDEDKGPKITIGVELLKKLLQWANNSSVTVEQINKVITNIESSVSSGRDVSSADYDRIIQGFNAQDGAQKSPAPMSYGDYKSTNPTRTIPYTNFNSYVS